MNTFTFSVPQNILIGRGSVSRLPEIIKGMHKSHAFIVSDPQLERMGIVQKCAGLLKENGIESDAFTETEGNPSVETVNRATERFLDSGADCIIALGGGSSMDVAKAVGLLATYGGSITEYEGSGKVPGPIVPLVALPTTAGTGSEVTAFSVITDHSRDYKLSVASNYLLPAYAIVDADLIATVPARVAAACGVDAMIHAIESYLSKGSNPFTDAMAEKALELIGRSIRRYVADRSNQAAGEDMIAGSLFAGIAFSSARLGNVHAMSHPVSAYFNVAHGVANAILLPVILEYNALADQGRYLKIYNYISRTPMTAAEFEPEMLVEEVRSLNRSLGIPANLREAGVTEDKIAPMAADAMKSGNIAANPRSSTIKDIEALYYRAMG